MYNTDLAMHESQLSQHRTEEHWYFSVCEELVPCEKRYLEGGHDSVEFISSLKDN